MFIDPGAYGRPDRPIAEGSVERPDEKYLLGDCVTAYGFDMETIAYLRYPNYDPSLRQNGWSMDQLTGLGRVAGPREDEPAITRHWLHSSMVVFADGHAKRLLQRDIPNNDRPYGNEYRELERHVAPWK
jgi:prepilin-type processing-associated H-X9-DG protein